MLQIAATSHLLGALAFFSTTIILFFQKNIRGQFPSLMVCTLLTALWSLSALLYILHLLPFYRVVVLTEICQDIAWCFCLVKLIQKTQNIQNLRWFNHLAFKGALFFIFLSLATNALFLEASWRPSWITQFTRFSFVGNIILSVIGLALIEQLYMGVSPDNRSRIRLIAIGLGLIFCYDFYLFSNALMLNEINMTSWAMRGCIGALAAPLITIGVIRSADKPYMFMPSRKLIFSTTAFLSCGGYLLIMASVGYGIRQFGGNWGKALQILFLSGSLLVLALLLTSGNVRAFVSQLLAKNIFKLRYDYRQEWMNISSFLSHVDQENINQLAIQMIADLVESPKGWLLTRKNAQFILVESWGVDMPSKNIYIEDLSVVQQLEAVSKPLVIDLELPDLSMVNWAWLLVPLKYLNQNEYFVILAHPRIPFSINWEVEDVLLMAGRQLAVTLVQLENARSLMLAKQFETFNQISAFIVHDLKNITAQVNLISKNKDKHGKNPDFVQSVYQTVDGLSAQLSKLLKQLKENAQIGTEKIYLKKAILEAINLRKDFFPVPSLLWGIKADDIAVIGEYCQFVNILVHLVENAQQATSDDGEIKINVSDMSTHVRIDVKDDGEGMSPKFIRDDLFKPFKTTKGQNGMGIGVYQAKTYIEQHKGIIKVMSELGKGTQFTLQFPIVEHIKYQASATDIPFDPEAENNIAH